VEIEIGEQTYGGNQWMAAFRVPGTGAGGVSVKVCRGVRTLRRDVNQRSDTFRVHLADEANAMIDNLLEIDTTARREAPAVSNCRWTSSAKTADAIVDSAVSLPR
jgi:hypothetical protein